MNRRFLFMILAGLTIIGLSTVNSTDAANQRVKFTFWHSYVGADQRAPLMAELLAQFKKTYPQIDVVEEKIPRDQYQTKLKTVAAAGQLPEAFVLWPNVMTKEFANANLLADINDLLAKDPAWRDGFIKAALDEFTVNGKTYSAGIGVSVTSIVFYNKALFAKYGLSFPKTYQELKNVISVFNQNGIIPITLGNKPKWPLQSSIFSLMANRETGSEWLTDVLAKKNGAKFTDTQFIRALTKLKELTDLGAFNKDYNSLDNVQMRDYFYRGQAAMTIDGSWMLTDLLEKAEPAFKQNIELGILPAFEDGDGDPAVISGVSGTGIVISAKATRVQQEAIKNLIRFVTDRRAQELYTKFSLPVSYKNVQFDKSLSDPIYVKLVKLIGNHPLVTVYDSALNSEQTEIINNGLQALMLGMVKPDDLARQLQATIK